MSNLIKNELTKIFKKKSIYIALAIVLVCIIFINCMNKFSNNDYYYYDNTAYLEEELRKYNPENPSDLSTYIQLKSRIDSEKMIKEYGPESWQASIIENKMQGLFSIMNSYEYGLEKDEKVYQEAKQKYDEFIRNFQKDDWKYFATIELEDVQRQIKEMEQQKENTVDKLKIQNISDEIENLKRQEKVVKWRLEKEISYAPSEKNSLLERYQMYSDQVQQLKNEQQSQAEKAQYQQYLAKMELTKYSIENDVNVNKTDDSRGMLISFFEQNAVFIVAIMVMIAGTIICEEFSKGTIKLLLVRPYPRWKILLSKLLTCIIAAGIITIAIFAMQFVVGGILFGFESFNLPAVYYNFTNQQVETMNLFGYIALIGLTKLPMFILLMIIAFMLGSVFNNSALSIVIALLGFMSGDIINMMAQELKLGFMKFFMTPNWDLSSYLFGGMPSFPGINLTFSIIIDIAYVILMLIPAFWIFQKKNIKNI